MDTFTITMLLSGAIFIVILTLQTKYFRDTRIRLGIYRNFFSKEGAYSTSTLNRLLNRYPQINQTCKKGSDLYHLIQEINTYLSKTKGTSDYEFIRNKVERKLKMRYDQSTVHMAFPTYLGLMGTFAGVFLGVVFFLIGFDGNGNISDASIKNLLSGVLVSMSTSLVGLILTTINNHAAGEARKKIEDDKNDFFDFIQMEVTMTMSASLVAAISKFHDTVDKFAPAFDSVINRFQDTFDRCTKAFGDNFEKNVVAVANAVNTMGENMDKVNENISLQRNLLKIYKSKNFINGLDKYIEAANHFFSITQSLNEFEKARRMMLEAAQKAIDIQNTYNESLKIPREIAIRINQILDRVRTFEESVNQLGRSLNEREILGNDVINMLRDQVNAILRNQRIVERFNGITDGKLEDLFNEQTKVLNEMNRRYRNAIDRHISGFEEMISTQTKELERRHSDFIHELQAKFNIDEVRSEFSDIKKLNDILLQLESIANNAIKSDDLTKKIQDLSGHLDKVEKHAATSEKMEQKMGNIINSLSQIEKTVKSQQHNTDDRKKGWLFPFGRDQKKD